MALHLRQENMHGHSGVTKLIKAKKCQLERVRRQRINERLEKLKIIVMKHLGNDVGFYPPMEKADILELAIRCLEGKENDQGEMQCSPELKKTTKESPLQQLNENTESPKTEREIEVTPIRKKGSSTKLERSSPSQTEQDIQKNTFSRQSRGALKPLFNHPINSITKCSKENGIPSRLSQPYQSSYTSPLTDTYLSQTIWRPWTQ